MSVHVISWVLQHSEAQHSERLVLIVLADHAQADGTGAYPALDTIQLEARLGSRSTVQRALDSLEAAGHIRATGRHPKGMRIWQVMMGNSGAFFRRDAGASEAVLASPESGSPRIGTPAEKRPADPDTAHDEIGTEPSVEPSSLEEVSLCCWTVPKDGSGREIGPPGDEKWAAVRDQLATEFGEFQAHFWIEPLELVALSAQRLVIAAPPHIATSVRERYSAAITRAARAELGRAVTVEVVVREPVEVPA